MKVPVVERNSTQIIQSLKRHKFNSTMSMLTGNFKEARNAQKEYAKLAVDNFELACKVENPVTGSIPLFSKMGFNLLKFSILNLFSKKTPEEKKFHTMVDLYRKGNLKIGQ